MMSDSVITKFLHFLLKASRHATDPYSFFSEVKNWERTDELLSIGFQYRI